MNKATEESWDNQWMSETFSDARLTTVEVTTYRKGWVHYTDLTRKVVIDVDSVNGIEQYFRGRVSQDVYNILMKGTLEEHDVASRNLMPISKND